MPRVAAIALTVAIVAFALPANAQQNIDFSKVEIKTIDLGHRGADCVGIPVPDRRNRQLAVAHDNCCGRGSSTAAEQR